MKVKKENLVKASKQILCSQEKVLVLIWDSENFCVHRRWIKSYFRFHKNFVFTRESSTVNFLPNSYLFNILTPGFTHPARRLCWLLWQRQADRQDPEGQRGEEGQEWQERTCCATPHHGQLMLPIPSGPLLLMRSWPAFIVSEYRLSLTYCWGLAATFRCLGKRMSCIIKDNSVFWAATTKGSKQCTFRSLLPETVR